MAAKNGASKDEPGYWRSIKVGDFVSLADSQSFVRGGSAGLDYRVADVRRVILRNRERNKEVAEYLIYDLELSGKVTLYFVVFTAGEEIELRAYFRPAGFAAGTRDALIDIGQTWLFLPPPNPNDFISSDLEYAPYPDVPPIDEGSGPVVRTYSAAGFGKPAYGSYLRSKEEVAVIVAEYSCAEEGALNPLLLVLEERWIDSDGSVPAEGGYVTTLLGCRIDAGEADIYPA